MRGITVTIRKATYALGIAGALAFGASQAVAEAPPCPLTSVGSCSNQAGCARTCERMGLPLAQGCQNGCCYCSLI